LSRAADLEGGLLLIVREVSGGDLGGALGGALGGELGGGQEEGPKR